MNRREIRVAIVGCIAIFVLFAVVVLASLFDRPWLAAVILGLGMTALFGWRLSRSTSARDRSALVVLVAFGTVIFVMSLLRIL